jgi:hypothetical protein
MKNGHEYFAKQEEDISNTYMSANGEILEQEDVPIGGKAGLGSLFSLRNKLFSQGQIKRLVITGIIAYVGYRLIKK